MVALIAAVVLTATPTVYKCTGADGAIAFQSQPCAGARSERVELRPEPAYTPPPPPPAAQTAPAPATPAPTLASAPPPPRAVSYRCEAENGEVWYRHSPCPIRVTATHGTVYRPGGAATVTSRAFVQQTEVPRTEACREISAIDRRDRPGSARDETVTPYDKRAGRDPC